MNFRLETTETFYGDWIEERVRDMKALKELGFYFTLDRTFEHWIKDQGIVHTYRIHGTPIIEINEWDDIFNLVKTFGSVIITEAAIRIYNGYE